MTTMTPPATTSKTELIRWAFDVLNTRDVTPLSQFWTEDTIEYFPGKTCRGTREITDYFNGVFAALPDLHIEIAAIAGEGDDVFAHWQLTATHSGAPFLGIDATGRPLSLVGIDHFVLRDNKVVSNTVVYDQMEFARQIGMMPADGSAGDHAIKAAFNAKTLIARRLQQRRR